ncbi:MAG: hypothetical protein UZ18_ATM001001129 [Armatimonadetes bacterium OLB18]|nr:MAG: hypothetical protein UZ18_ATM001001129 [Armatimonadetes bacterium OLB18]
MPATTGYGSARATTRPEFRRVPCLGGTGTTDSRRFRVRILTLAPSTPCKRTAGTTTRALSSGSALGSGRWQAAPEPSSMRLPIRSHGWNNGRFPWPTNMWAAFGAPASSTAIPPSSRVGRSRPTDPEMAAPRVRLGLYRQAHPRPQESGQLHLCRWARGNPVLERRPQERLSFVQGAEALAGLHP